MTMCAQTAAAPDNLPAKARPLVDYLRARVREEGNIYAKSRFIAEDIDLSSKEIGSYMKRLQTADTELTIEQWSYTNGTTWRVSAEK
jgi:hypothetical protein